MKGTVFTALFVTGILIIIFFMLILPLDTKQVTHDGLSTNLLESIENMCFGITPAGNTSYCNSINFVFTGFVSSFPPLDTDNKFDVKYCTKVDSLLYELDKLMYQDNYHEDGFFNLSDDEIRKKVTLTMLEKNQMNEFHYDVIYKFVESVDEFLLFWNDTYNRSCNK